MPSLIEQFKAHAAILPPVSPEEAERYDAYFALLKEWNEKVNLVSRKSIDASFAPHFADSVHIAHFAYEHREKRELSDLGTGAGFPGMIFAIRYPQVRVKVFEKLAKRRLFLADAIEKLGMSNVVLEGALTDTKSSDLFTARAVFPPEELFEFLKRRLWPGGRMVLSIGGSKEFPETPAQYKKIAEYAYELPEGAGPRKNAVYELVPRGTK